MTRTLAPGVYSYRGGRFKAHPSIGGQMVYLGIFDTEDEAVEHIERARAKYAESQAAREKNTYRAWAEEWLDERETSGKHHNAVTDRSRMNKHILSAPWVDMSIRTIKTQHLREWLHQVERTKASTFGKGGKQVASKKTIEPQTVWHIYNLVRKSFADAVLAGKISENPILGLTPREQPRPERAIHLTQDEIERLLSLPSLPPRLRRIYTVAIYTGMRPGELWALEWKDVHEEAKRPEVVARYSNRKETKTKEIRHVPLLPPAIAAIKEQRAQGIDSPLVFPAGVHGGGKGWRGWHQASEGYDAQWQVWARKAGINTRRVKFKHLRHTCGSHLVAGTWGVALTIYQVAAWLGHEDSRTTEEHYAHLTPDALDKARRSLAKFWDET